MKQTVDRVEEQTREAKEAFEMFLPFTVENEYVFRADNVRALFGRIRADEQQLLTWNPESFDWYDYWMNTHLPGLKKWVLPTLEEDMRAQPKRVYTYRDLVELFETTTKRHATRVAMRVERDGRKEQYTYADLGELATRAAAFFAGHGIKSGDRVILFSHNAPEWGMTYFGVLKAGGVHSRRGLEGIANLGGLLRADPRLSPTTTEYPVIAAAFLVALEYGPDALSHRLKPVATATAAAMTSKR